MTPTRCVHGIDSRFCAVCNRTSKVTRSAGAIGSVDLPQILKFLNQEQVRATYKAVGEVLGIIPRALGAHLGPHTPERSWIVNADTGRPTDYGKDHLHPALFRTNEIISSGTELLMRMSSTTSSRRRSSLAARGR